MRENKSYQAKHRRTLTPAQEEQRLWDGYMAGFMTHAEYMRQMRTIR